MIAQSSDGIPRFFVDSGRSYDSKYITEGDAKNVRPAIMSDHNVFASSGEHLHMANNNVSVSQHSDKDILDAGGGGFDDKIFAKSSSHNLYASRFDQDKHKWVWDKHGRPVKKKHSQNYVVGSMRRLNQGLLFLIKPKWGNSDDNYRVYYCWQDTDGDWLWRIMVTQTPKRLARFVSLGTISSLLERRLESFMSVIGTPMSGIGHGKTTVLLNV